MTWLGKDDPELDMAFVPSLVFLIVIVLALVFVGIMIKRVLPDIHQIRNEQQEYRHSLDRR